MTIEERKFQRMIEQRLLSQGCHIRQEWFKTPFGRMSLWTRGLETIYVSYDDDRVDETTFQYCIGTVTGIKL